MFFYGIIFLHKRKHIKHRFVIHNTSGFAIFHLYETFVDKALLEHLASVDSSLIDQSDMTVDSHKKYRCIWKQDIQNFFSGQLFVCPVIIVPTSTHQPFACICFLKAFYFFYHLIKRIGRVQGSGEICST